MAADEVAHIVDLHLAAELLEALLDQVRHGPGILHTFRLADIALAAVLEPALGTFLHLLHDLLDDPLFAGDLEAGDQAAQGVHVQQGADAQDAAEEARRLGDTAALHIEAQVRGEEPVIQAQPVLLRPGAEFVDGETFVPLVRQSVHEQAVAGGGAQGIHDVDLPLREALPADVGGVGGGIVGAGDAGGEGDV